MGIKKKSPKSELSNCKPEACRDVYCEACKEGRVITKEGKRVKLSRHEFVNKHKAHLAKIKII